MRVALISRDNSLQRLCHTVLASLNGQRWELETVSPGDPEPAADICLRDWEPGQPLPDSGSQSAVEMLIVGRQEAREILDLLPSSAVTLVLKPVNADALRTFFEQAGRRTENAGDLRRDRDTILDWLLASSLRLQEYDQDRMNFLSRVVHDFRTPLTAVNGYCGLLLSGEFGTLTAAQREVLDRTLHSVRRLGRLATALFQWSSGARTGFEAQPRDGDIEECCRQALHEIRPLAGEKNIYVDLDLQAPRLPLRFDPAQIEQLLINLLENSCKFTPKGGFIQVRGSSVFWDRRSAAVSRAGIMAERRRHAARSANAYRVEVSDNGMGVRPEHLQTIFQEYTSYGGGGDRSGSGLGLAICRRILAEHGGEIHAESGKQGVTFIFHLPFAGQIEQESSGIARSAMQVAAETAAGVRG